MKKVVNVANIVEADQIIALLSSYEISAIKKAVGGGGYTTITANLSAAGYDILVSEDVWDTAKTIVEELYETDEDNNIREPDETKAPVWTKKNVVRVVVILLLIFWGVTMVGLIIWRFLG